MSATVTAILALVTALLDETPTLWKMFQDLLSSHPANPANQPSALAPQVVAETQPEVDALNNTVIK